jgi:hypothetical protein
VVISFGLDRLAQRSDSKAELPRDDAGGGNVAALAREF